MLRGLASHLYLLYVYLLLFIHKLVEFSMCCDGNFRISNLWEWKIIREDAMHVLGLFMGDMMKYERVCYIL